MFRNNKTANAVRLALIAGAATTAFSMPAAFAADEKSVEEEKVERIEVTGSRIKRTDLETSSPVQVTSAEDIKISGFTRVEDMLNTLPQIEASSTAFQANGASGRAGVDLRGLGSHRTLVLINGRRMGPGGGSSAAADVNAIPSALVKRVDVMTGGASSTYGADAVAGVVNFVMDKEFEGVKIDLGASGFQHNNDNDYIQALMDAKGFDYPSGNTGIDGKSYNIDFTAGSELAGGKGHAVVYATYKKTDELRQSARDYSSCALNGAGDTCGGSANAVIPNFDMFAVNPDGTVDYSREMWSSLDENSNFIDSPSSNRYNYAPINHFMRPDTKLTLGAMLNYEINDTFRPYMEVSFMQDKTRAQIAESGTFFNEEYIIDLANPLLNDAQRAQLASGLGVDATTGQAAVYIGKRNVEGGPRVDIIEHNAYRIVLGTEGEINDTWSYDASIQYGNTTNANLYQNDILAPLITEAISASGQTCTDDCIPYEVFTYNGVTSEQADTLTATASRSSSSERLVVSAYATGDLDFSFPSATSPVAVVFGAEYRDESYEAISDDLYEKGSLLGQGGPTPSLTGGYDVTEVYAEANLPIVEDAPFAEALSIDLGYRYSDYSTSGGEQSYKIGLDWTPIEDWKIRASYNRAVRAANIGELYATQSIGLWEGEDPCAGASPTLSAAQCANTGMTAAQYGTVSSSPAGQYNALFGGNPELSPEIADTYTLGLVGQVTEEIDFSLDYWSIEIEDVISSLDPQFAVEECAKTGSAVFCDVVNRSPSGSLWLGQAGYLVSTDINLSSQKWEGTDVSASYRSEIAGGNLSATFIGTYMMTKETTSLPGADPYDCAGSVSNKCFPQPDWRHVVNVNFDQEDWGVNVKWRYMGRVDYDGTTDLLIANGIASQSYIDVAGSYIISENVTARLGINNIFDKEKPINGNTVDTGAFYDSLGRYVHASVSLTF